MPGPLHTRTPFARLRWVFWLVWIVWMAVCAWGLLEILRASAEIARALAGADA
jgi:hypothetical protein